MHHVRRALSVLRLADGSCSTHRARPWLERSSCDEGFPLHKMAPRLVEFADALLAASDEAYASSLETYRRGLGSLVC